MTNNPISCAIKFYRENLYSSVGVSAMNYLKSRGLDSKIIDKFELGFAQESWNSVGLYLKKLGFSDEEIIKSGLVVQKDNSSGYYDRFRKRIMFPILDANGLPIGFTGRLLPEDEGKEKSGGKYINTPETPLYHKAFTLYGLSHAKEHIRKTDMAIFVEGQMDVIASHMDGVCNVVAMSGTSLSEYQIRTIKMFTNNITLAFDKDSAGEKAMNRVAITALRFGCNVHTIHYVPGCKDPFDIIINNRASWKNLVKTTIPIIDYFIDDLVVGDKNALERVLDCLIACKENNKHVYKLSKKINIDSEHINSILNVYQT